MGFDIDTIQIDDGLMDFRSNVSILSYIVSSKLDSVTMSGYRFLTSPLLFDLTINLLYFNDLFFNFSKKL